tara:strand:- start:596 stop:787 length:192 start_codon:yes stop_codon:yes gene_type:complete
VAFAVMLPFEFVTIQLPLPPRLNVDCSDEELVEWMKKAAWNSIRLDFASSEGACSCLEGTAIF